MKINYDPKVDALSIIFVDTTVTTVELADGITAEYDSEGKLAGIETLDFEDRFGSKDTLYKVVLEGK